MAGGELRLGTVSMYMGTVYRGQISLSSIIFSITWEHLAPR